MHSSTPLLSLFVPTLPVAFFLGVLSVAIRSSVIPHPPHPSSPSRQQLCPFAHEWVLVPFECPLGILPGSTPPHKPVDTVLRTPVHFITTTPEQGRIPPLPLADTSSSASLALVRRQDNLNRMSLDSQPSRFLFGSNDTIV